MDVENIYDNNFILNISKMKGRPRLKTYTKVCKRCNEIYNTTHKYSKVCKQCQINLGAGK